MAAVRGAGYAASVRRFNTAGPCRPDWHYMLPPEARLPEARRLVEQRGYFVLHAPRQTGKTTLLRSLAAALTAEGEYAALATTCEAAEPAGDAIQQAQEILISQLADDAISQLPPDLRPPALSAAPTGREFGAFLSAWARACPRPIALFLDEIDALRGESLRAVLRQLRAGYPGRPNDFPWSVGLCGLRDVRDYRVASGGDPDRLGTSSPFNIKIESLRLQIFDEAEMRALLQQHTAETGQPFTEEALVGLFEATGGQPWLVNAAAREIVEKLGVEAPSPITRAHVDAARERLVLARQTHLDSLVARLHEPRVRRVIANLLEGDLPAGGGTYNDDVSYVRDLGLISNDRPLRIANPIYREVIVRVVSELAEDSIDFEGRSFVLPDGGLDLKTTLTEFCAFWVEHGDVLSTRMTYPESAPQLVLMAWLQRVVNGGGYIDREYGVGRGRIDLLVRWPLPDGTRQREALELKVWRDGRPDPLTSGLSQLDAYLDRLGLDTGVLVVFDRRSDAPPIDVRTRLESALSPAGRDITVLRG